LKRPPAAVRQRTEQPETRLAARQDAEKDFAMRLLGLVIGALVILGSAISFRQTRICRLSLERSGDDAGRTLRDRRPENRNWAGVRARRASIAGPRTLRVLGLIVIIAGLATPWFGVARARQS